MTDELAPFTQLHPNVDHAALEQRLVDAGWTRCGAGDWAVVLASPARRLAARISPFDPVAPYTAELFRRAAGTRQVPELHAYADLEGGGVVTVLELLEPVPAEDASAFFTELARREPHVRLLAETLAAVHAEARRELPWFGPVDPNPANVMRRADGTLVLTDPFYADGPNLYASLLSDASKVARLIPAERRRHMFELPMTETGPFDPEQRRRMEAALANADADSAPRAAT